MTHTPTSWVKVVSPTRSWVASSETGVIICDKPYETREELWSANAEFIIKACNAHDELVKVLKGVLSHNQALKEQYQLPDSLISQIERALTKAEKGV